MTEDLLHVSLQAAHCTNFKSNLKITGSSACVQEATGIYLPESLEVTSSFLNQSQTDSISSILL